jgi:hypothetical protein
VKSWQIEWGKLGILAISLMFGFALVIIALLVLPGDDARFAACLSFGTGTVGSVLGYVTGNGRLASRGEPSVPAIGRPTETEQ